MVTGKRPLECDPDELEAAGMAGAGFLPRITRMSRIIAEDTLPSVLSAVHSSQGQVQHERDPEADEPCVAVKLQQPRREGRGIERLHVDQKTWQARQRAGPQCGDCDPTDAAAIGVFSLLRVERLDIQPAAAMIPIFGSIRPEASM